MKEKVQQIKKYIFLHVCILIYTLSTVMTKYASQYDFLSIKYLMCMLLVFVILGVYAILWQQIIKRVDLSIAYVNRSMAIIYSMLWAFLIFSEKIRPQNIIGVIIIVLGTLIVNSDNA